MSQTALSDGHLLIRPFRTEDLNALYEAVRESIAEVSSWLPWCHSNYAIEDSYAFILSRKDAWGDESEYSFAVFDAKTETFLGGVGLSQVNRIYRCANLGYWVRSSRAGHGVASSAARLAARYGLEELGLQRIEILAATGNLASQRAALKAGAVREGVLRKRLMVNGQAQDAVVYSLVAEDFAGDG
ncbi:MAG TPA: GNAT family protein [Pyrinomonadaceae bacterium]|jgi:RimJ/RimL family protein N-acetyltransferase|nr:GNAT family protein [Pyrinomonadaceae bacterium]